MFELGFAISLIPEMLRGLWVTMIATFGGFALALLVGSLLEAGRRSGVSSSGLRLPRGS